MVLLGDLATDAASLEQFVSSASYVVYLNGLVPQAVTLNHPFGMLGRELIPVLGDTGESPQHLGARLLELRGTRYQGSLGRLLYAIHLGLE